MEDPLYTLPFIKEIINEKAGSIVGVAISKGGRFKIGKKRSKFIYALSLLLIMGLFGFVKNVMLTIRFKLKVQFSKFLTFIENPGLESFCKEKKIPLRQIKSPNNKEFLSFLREEEIDIIINQSQFIIKKELLAIPTIGVLNRHNALLPKNRGRLTPFWVLFKGEKETGVSIHFVNEGLDSGEIVVQERYELSKKDNFNSIVEKNYQIAPKAMFKAIDILASGKYTLIPNPDSEATLNTVPTFKEAFTFRMRQIGIGT